MSDIFENEDHIICRHRKEKKELQSKIQALKKSASKGDKKKRKEVLDEIAKLELDLEKRQTEELNNSENLRNVEFIQNEPETVDRNTVTSNEIDCKEKTEVIDLHNSEANQEIRISKAQKRRDKKAQQAKEKEAEIQAYEEENKNGPRAVEILAINDILKKRGLKLFMIPSDGNCLYNAILHQMSIIGKTLSPLETNSSFNINQKEKINYLRNETANYIEKNKDNLIFYMTGHDTENSMTNEEFDIYCNQIRNTSSWGGQIEIRAIANILKVKIEVLQASGPPTIQESEDNKAGPSLIITYHRHMYSLGEHYNSTISIHEEDDSFINDDQY